MIIRAGKSLQAPAAVGLAGMSRLHRLGVCAAYHRCGMEARAGREASGQMLMRGVPANDGRTIVRAHAGRKATVPLKVLLKLLRVDPDGLAASTLLRTLVKIISTFGCS